MEQYNVGDVIKGTVISITNYGAFLKIDDDFMGLVHISEVSPDYVHSINHYVRVGDKVEAKVIELDKEKKQVKLSFKQLEKPIKPIYKNKIIDTEHGFDSLKDQLEVWIDEKNSAIE